jgi:tRNA-specific 2-thiouridylase
MRHGEESAEACRIEGAGESPLLPILQGRADHKQGCCSASDAVDARRVADHFGIPFYSLNLQKDFRRIVDYFVDDYTHGRTPNPCVMCNNWIKFGRLFEFADGLDADYVATGHYARITHDAAGTPELRRGIDSGKDQSYALFGVDPGRLGQMLLPVGDFAKSEIRQRAAELGLGVAEKRDSQEICFVTSGHHSDFVRSRRGPDAPTTAGDIVTTAGRTVGHHAGIEAFTIGQRKGLGVALGEPHFVVEIDPQTNRVIIGSHDELQRGELVAENANWLVPTDQIPPDCQVQIRYNSAPEVATVQLDSEDPSRFQVRFQTPQAGVAPGQAAVVYQGDRVLGGGWIE